MAKRRHVRPRVANAHPLRYLCRAMARFAAIDVGSNAMRARIVELDRVRGAASAGAFRELASQRAPLRLGRDVFRLGALSPRAIAATCDALRRVRDAMDDARVEVYRAVATSAVREAKNGAVLVERAEREAGVRLEIIEGVEEARLVALAVERRLELAERSALLVDVGGGSTEVTLVQRGHTRWSQSLQVGTVRLLEAFGSEGGAWTPKQLAMLDRQIDRALVEAPRELSSGNVDLLVGTGGNVDSLAVLCPAPTPDGTGVDVGRMRALLVTIAPLTAEARAERYALRPDRADVIVPAAAILLRLAERLRIGTIAAPGVGLKEGILEEIAARHFSRWDTGAEEQLVLEAALRLGRRYRFDEPHGLLVANAAATLFDALTSKHGLARRDRLLLHTGALLHDVGDFVRYEGHHKHGQYLIEHGDLMGLTPVERRVVACLARYHRKGPPDPAHEGYGALGRDDRQRVRVLTALLRIADALDREHRGKVKAVRPVVERGKLVVRVDAETSIDLEEWTLAHKAGLFREVFGMDVVVVAN